MSLPILLLLLIFICASQIHSLPFSTLQTVYLLFPSQNDQDVLLKAAQANLTNGTLFQRKPQIEIQPKSINIVPIQQYNAIKMIYPSKIVKQKANGQEQTYKNISKIDIKHVFNQNTRIQWKDVAIGELNDFIVQNGEEIPLSHPLIVSKGGQGQLATQGYLQNTQSSLISSEITRLKPKEQKPLAKQNEVIVENPQQIHSYDEKLPVITTIVILAFILIGIFAMKCLGRHKNYSKIKKILQNQQKPSKIVIIELQQVMQSQSDQFYKLQQ